MRGYTKTGNQERQTWRNMRDMEKSDSPMLMVKGDPKRAAGKVGRPCQHQTRLAKSGGSGRENSKMTLAEYVLDLQLRENQGKGPANNI